jgi:hypothetical protein
VLSLPLGTIYVLSSVSRDPYSSSQATPGESEKDIVLQNNSSYMPIHLTQHTTVAREMSHGVITEARDMEKTGDMSKNDGGNESVTFFENRNNVNYNKICL